MKNTNKDIWIDLGLKDFAICSYGDNCKNINKNQKVKKLEKKLKREQNELKKKGGTATKSNINKEMVKIQKLFIFDCILSGRKLL